MFTQIHGTKKYTLNKLYYQVVADVESLYLEFNIVEDIEFGTREYLYGMTFNGEEIEYFKMQIEGMKDYVLTKLLSLNA